MTEIWLQSNRRVLAMALVPAALLSIVGWLLFRSAESRVLEVLSAGLVVLGVMLTIGLAGQFRRPRIAFRDGDVLFYLRVGAPVAVPVAVVEAFFLGQGPAHLPPAWRRDAETVNLIARMSQKSPEWAHVEVKPALGHWCEGYVTMRGAWCEALNMEVIRRLNSRLRELHAPQAAEAIADA